MPVGNEKEFTLDDKVKVSLYRIVQGYDRHTGENSHDVALGIEIHGIAATKEVKDGRYCGEEGKHPHYVGATNYLINEFEKAIKASNHTKQGTLGQFNDDRHAGTDEMAQRFSYNTTSEQWGHVLKGTWGLDPGFSNRSGRLYNELAVKMEKEWLPKAKAMVEQAKNTVEAPDYEGRTEAGKQFQRMVSKAQAKAERYADVTDKVIAIVVDTSQNTESFDIAHTIAHAIVDTILPELLDRRNGIKPASIHDENSAAKAAVQKAYPEMDDFTAQGLANLIANELLPEERSRQSGRN